MAEHARHVRGESAYVISVPMQVRAVMRRRVQILRGGWGAQVIQTVSFALNAIILGTTFLKVPKNTGAYFSRGGIIFFSLFLPALFTMAEIPALFAQRPIVLRHQQAALYHPFAEALAMTLVDIPMTFVTIGVFSTVLYFLVDLQRTAAQFFTFFLFIFTLAMAMKTFFRMLAAAFGSEAPAQAVAGVLLLATALYTGYQIQIDAMVWPLRAISYINPLRYGFESLMVNEFHTLNGQCSTLVPSGPGYAGVSTANQVCTTVGSQAGQAAVSGTRFVEISFGYQLSHLWRNYAIDAAFAIFFLLALLVFTEYNTRSAGEKSSALLFKPGSRAAALQEASAAVGADEEKAAMGRQREQNLANRDAKAQEEKVKAEKAMEAQPTMENVFSWQHIEYEISANGERKRLLDDVSGYVAPGKLTALMGESGAGKTTLLNVLAERVDTGVVHGDRFVNGQALPPDFQAQTGYCQQTDTHVPTTTVREALLFSAKMRQPQSVPIAEKEAYVEQCLKMCGLEEFADAMVGSLGVEHRKRTTIGVELAAKPKLLLFLDEPTSGLDSQSAWAILAFLRELAEHGQGILCTIHQPSAELFQVFDRLLLLKKGGQTVYFGDLGHNAETIINYFEAHGSRRCKPGENPAEFMLDVIGAGATASTDRDWHGIWLDSKEAGELQNTIENIHTEGRKNPAIGAELEKTFATSWFYQTGTLLARGHVSYWRDPTYLMSKLALNIIGGLFIGFTFFKSKDTLQGSQQKVFAIFMATIMSAPLSGQLHVPFINLRNVYEIRERSSRMYSWSALITSQILTEVPWNMFGSSLFFVCWYWTVGFATSRAGYAYLMYGVLFPMYFSTVALAVAAFSPTAEIAGLLFNFLFSFVLTFDGVVEPYAQLTFWKFAYRVSPYTYLIEGLIGHTLGGKQINCAEREFVTLEPPSGSTCGSFLQQFISNQGGYLENPSASSNCQFCSSRTTDQYFGPTFNIFYNHAWRDTGLFCGYIVFNTFLVFLFTYLFRVRSRSIIRFFKRSRKA